MKAQVTWPGLSTLLGRVTGVVYRIRRGRSVDLGLRTAATGRRLPVSGGDQVGELFGSGCAHAGEQVLVCVHGERRVGVAEAFGDDLDRDAGGDEE